MLDLDDLSALDNNNKRISLKDSNPGVHDGELRQSVNVEVFFLPEPQTHGVGYQG